MGKKKSGSALNWDVTSWLWLSRIWRQLLLGATPWSFLWNALSHSFLDMDSCYFIPAATHTTSALAVTPAPCCLIEWPEAKMTGSPSA